MNFSSEWISNDGSLQPKVNFCRLQTPAHARITCHPIFLNNPKNNFLFVKTGGADTAPKIPGLRGQNLPHRFNPQPRFWHCPAPLGVWSCLCKVRRTPPQAQDAVLDVLSPFPRCPMSPSPALLPAPDQCQHTGELAAIPDSASPPRLGGTILSWEGLPGSCCALPGLNIPCSKSTTGNLISSSNRRAEGEI